MRQLALEFAMEIQPHLSVDKLQQIADALNGAAEAVNRSCVTVPTDWKLKSTLPPIWEDLHSIDNTDIFVDFLHGSDDTNDGSITSPFQHLDTAIAFARIKYGKDTLKRIILRKGRHYLRKSIEITPADNNLLITNFNGENVELSGAKPLNCKWTKQPSEPIWNILPNVDGIFDGPSAPGMNTSTLIFLGTMSS